MRIHELAKELDKSSKDLLAVLEEKGIKKSAQSSVDDECMNIIKSAFAPKTEPSAPKADKAEEKKEPAKKKKPNIVFVSNPGNARDNRQDRRGGYAPKDRPDRNGRTVGSIGGGKVSVDNSKQNAQNKSVKAENVEAAFAKSLGIDKSKKSAPAQEAPAAMPAKEEAPRRFLKIREENVEEKAPVKNTQPRAERSENVENNKERNNDRPQRQEKSERHEQNKHFEKSERRNGRDEKGKMGDDDFKGNNRSDSRRFNSNGRNERSKDKKVSNNIFTTGPVDGKPGKGGRRDERKRHDVDYDEREASKQKKFNPHGFHKPEKVEAPVEEKIKVITLPEKITIRDLADKMKIQAAGIIKKLFLKGQIVTLNTELSFEEAENIAIEYEIICEQEEKVDLIAELLKENEEDESKLVKRPPVVCVMGHVDHGKTSLLDAIRKTNVTDKEAGGITQAIGAYMVSINGEKITFLDTPGHEAFTAMRMRGANSTDIAILVVAADDGVMPQTVEAINHAKAAGIEIIVAVNKIDKPNANVDRVKQELAEYELIPEDWGGSTVFAEVSAKSGQGIENLLEMVLLTADILELKADPKRKARGIVIEAELDKGRGPVATILVQKGTLKVGDFIAAGACHGKVRAMNDEHGRRIKEAGPSTPVEILGLSDVPGAGEIFISPNTDKEAKDFAQTFVSQNREKMLEDTKQRMSLDNFYSQIQEGTLKELNLIVKADVQGSVEAVKDSLTKLSNEEVIVKVIHGGVGAINESDVILASASKAIIIGFNVRPDVQAKSTAEAEGVDMRLYKVIYQAIEDVEAAMRGMLDPVFEERIIGHAEVRQIFKASAIGNIAGSYVLDGTFERDCMVRITREGEQIFEGKLASLKRFKDDVKEVKAGFECGLVFEDFGNMQELDIVEAYKMVEVSRA